MAALRWEKMILVSPNTGIRIDKNRFIWVFKISPWQNLVYSTYNFFWQLRLHWICKLKYRKKLFCYATPNCSQEFKKLRYQRCQKHTNWSRFTRPPPPPPTFFIYSREESGSTVLRVEFFIPYCLGGGRRASWRRGGTPCALPQFLRLPLSGFSGPPFICLPVPWRLT